MSYPSIKAIHERLNVSKAIAKQIRSVMDGSTDPVTVGTKASQHVKDCFVRPKDNILKLYAIDDLLGAQGVASCLYGGVKYCNRGDDYIPTVLYFPDDRRFRIDSYIHHLVSS